MIRAIVLFLAMSAVAVAAEKKPAIGNFPFWSAPKREFCDQFVPGLNAVLMLTPDQIAKLHEARQATIDSEAIRAGSRKDPNLTDAQREARHKLVNDAQMELRQKASNILDASQRAIIEKANAAYGDVLSAVGREFEPRYGMVKGNEEATATLRKEQQERIAADFLLRLDGILSAEQKLILAEAAAQEKSLAANKQKK